MKRIICLKAFSQAKYIRCIFELLNSSSHAVKYEAATTLTTLTQNPAAVKGIYNTAKSLITPNHTLAAASCFVTLVLKESDNNVKLIVLDRLDQLRSRHGRILDTLIMDVLQVLSTSDMEVRRKAIGIVLAMTTSRNVEDVVLFLKKELQKTQEVDFEKVIELKYQAINLRLTLCTTGA